jgi:hypothetical protein
MARAECSGAGAFRIEPPGGRIEEARRSVCSSALPSRWGARTSPGSPAQGGGSPAAMLHQSLHGPVRGRRRRQSHLGDHSGASFSWSGRRGGSASAVCAMAQPWTMVAWARGPRDQTTLPSQRRAGGSVDGGGARCPWNTAHTRATAVGHQRVASGWQRWRGEPCATPWADRGGWDRAGSKACSSGVVHTPWGKWGARAGELLPSAGLRHPACWGSSGMCVAQGRVARAGRAPSGAVWTLTGDCAAAARLCRQSATEERR